MPFMPSELLGILGDIETNINLAIRFTSELDYGAFCEDTRTIYAVIRCLEIISEASRRLPDDLKMRHPAIPWGDIAGAGNVYRHDYEDVAAKVLWDTVQLALPPLRTVIVGETERILASQSGESSNRS
jgi:uncharacterized protein with HEPN domain